MKIYYDCEFIDDDKTIDLVSIGMRAKDGREFYAVNSQFNMRKFAKNNFLVDQVFRGLPMYHGDARMSRITNIRPEWMVTKKQGLNQVFNRHDPVVMPHAFIASHVRSFIAVTPKPELWAWYGAYDHVCYAQLFGAMVDLPKGFPMHTNDLKQECNRLGNPRLPLQVEGKHNALDDARHNEVIDDFLIKYEREEFVKRWS